VAVSRPVGRLAPSPTGILHLGNARSLLLAWLSARARGGAVILRVEDLVPCDDAAVTALLEDLAWLGLDWDPPPEAAAADAALRRASDYGVSDGCSAPFVLQSARRPRHLQAFEALRASGEVFPCVCTRKDIEQAVRAPHAEELGDAYPGTCRGRFATLEEARKQVAARFGDGQRDAVAWRLRVDAAPQVFEDALAGRVRVDVQASAGDVVVRRKDGAFAYMFAVVVDDLDAGVTEIVRGRDLLTATAQQLLVAQALARHGQAPSAPQQRWVHVPLVRGGDGRRLAKRERSFHLQTLREAGVPRERLWAWLADSLGLRVDTPHPHRLAAVFDWTQTPHDDVVFDDAAQARWFPATL
jgi:glutamyl-tRNA synthetase